MAGRATAAACYFSSTSRDIAGMNDVFRVALDGGTPMAVTEERYVNEFGAAASPDGRQLAFAARGIASSQWWRRGSSHIDQSELWTVDLDGAAGLRAAHAARRAAAVADVERRRPDAVLRVRSRRRRERLVASGAASVGRARRRDDRRRDPIGGPLTTFTDGRVLWPSITADGRTIAFERDFGDLDARHAAAARRGRCPIVRRGAPTTPAPERVRQTAQFTDLALSPDGRKVAFIARGDVFAASAKDGGDAARVTASPEIESQPVWTPDSRQARLRLGARRRPADLSLRLRGGDGDGRSRRGDGDRSVAGVLARRQAASRSCAIAASCACSTSRPGTDRAARDRHVRRHDRRSEAGRGRRTATGSRSSRSARRRSPTSSSCPPPAARRRARSASSPTSSPTRVVWSRDGTYLLFDTRQRTEPGQLARVDLDAAHAEVPRGSVPRSVHASRDASDPAAGTEPAEPEPPNPEPPEPEPEPRNPGTPGTPEPRNPRTRVRRHPPASVASSRSASTSSDVAISPDGKTAAVIAVGGGPDQPLLRTRSTSWPPNGRSRGSCRRRPARKPIRSSRRTAARSISWTRGRIQIATVERRDVRPLTVTAEFTVDFASEKRQVFQQAWTLLRDNFFDARLQRRELGSVARALRPARGGRRRPPTSCAGSSA